MKVFDKPLSAEEEKIMLDRFHKGDMEARNILVEKNMRLVAHMIKKYSTTERDPEDLISVGTIGLIKAVNSFKTDKSIRFATYAAKCIDNEILMMLRSERRKMNEVSLYEPVGADKEGNEISIIDVISDEEIDVVEEHMLSEQIKCLKEHMKNVLSKRECLIIVNRYGLAGREEMTQSDLAKKLGISRSYVSRIEKRALEKLKALLEEQGKIS
ncbi:MAG: RNA polymerase sporulation sigma factor SigK [Lachnospira sp.]|nr:RNA polymerase sporulation sigma factor SigK [Lachnospira sp.]